jgi:alpha-tubulin suppressor-like RCC1 family protein
MNTDIVEPTLINIKETNLDGLLGKVIIKHIAASKDHVLVTTSDGRCFGWGNNEFGQLGIGSNMDVIKMPTYNTELR